jgi:hypothetical protein
MNIGLNKMWYPPAACFVRAVASATLTGNLFFVEEMNSEGLWIMTLTASADYSIFPA